jgi:hypothetical protein
MSIRAVQLSRLRWPRHDRVPRLLAVAVVLLLAACGASDVAVPDVGGPVVIGGAAAYVREAEAVVVGAAFVVGEDAMASGGYYLTQPPTIPASSTGAEAASLSIEVEEDGDYTLWARVFAPSLASDAVYLGLEGTLRRVFPDALGAFVWIAVERAALTAGTHRIGIGHGEPGLRIDLFALVMDASATGGELEVLVAPAKSRGGKKPAPTPAPDPEPAPEPVPPPPSEGTRYAPSLRGDPDFDPATLTGEMAVWYGRLQASLTLPTSDLDPMAMAASDDLYTFGRTLHAYVQSVLVVFRLTGDLRLLDHVDAITERMRRDLHDGWRDTVDGSDGTRDGYLNWVYRYSDEPDLKGKDTHRSNEMRTHAMLAAVAYTLQLNRDLASPTGRDYGAHADFWRDYLVHHFEAKWRERSGVPTAFPIMTVPQTHSYYAWTKWHYYMGRLTGDGRYLTEASRMADVLWGELRSVATPAGTAYVWARSVLALGGTADYLHPTTYARYVFGDIAEFHLEGFHRWASEAELPRFTRTFTEFVMDVNDPMTGGFASDVGGGVARAGLVTDDAWPRMTVNRYRVSAYALIGAWDPTDALPGVTADAYAAKGASGGAMMAAGSFVDAWRSASAIELSAATAR